MRKRILLYILLVCSACFDASAQLNKQYFFYVGRNYLLDNKYHDAIDILNVLLKSDSSAYEAFFLRGVAKYNLDDLLGAEQDFTKALQRNPVFTLAYQYRAITRSILGNYDDALKDFQEAINLRPDIPGPLYSRGVTYLLNQQFEKAAEDFTNFIKKESKVADAYINRGTAYLYMKDTTRAYEDYNTAIATNRDYPTGYNRRGSLYMAQKKYPEALADFNMAIDKDSANIGAYFNRAVVYANTNKPMEALTDFDKVLTLDSTSSVTYFNRALLRTQIGAYNKALEDYNKVTFFSPNNVLAYFNRGALLAQLGNFEEAVDDYTKAIELYPDFANAYLRRSELKHLLRDTKGAQNDKNIAESKIAEYKSKLNDSTFSIYADTSQQFNRLLSFDSKIGNNSANLNKIAAHDADITLQPMFKFTIRRPEDLTAVPISNRYFAHELEEFKRSVGFDYLSMTTADTNIPADSLIMFDRQFTDSVQTNNESWQALFLKGLSQSLVKQYTNAITSYTAAIDRNPSNAFLYINRSTTQSEMIDFISSLDNGFQRIAFDSDPASRLKGNTSRTYNYDSAIADLNAAAKLMPDYAVIYYNRANLLCLSGFMPEAIEDYTKAIELNPAFAEAYFNRGLIQIYLKDTRKGSLDMSKAGELGINSAYKVLKLYGQTGK